MSEYLSCLADAQLRLNCAVKHIAYRASSSTGLAHFVQAASHVASFIPIPCLAVANVVLKLAAVLAQGIHAPNVVLETNQGTIEADRVILTVPLTVLQVLMR